MGVGLEGTPDRFPFVVRPPGCVYTRRAFNDEGVKMLCWPPKSPDLNPIENIWGIMDEHINALCPTNREDLRRAIASGVEKLKGEQYDVFLRTLKSVPTRVKILLEKKGGNCGY